MSARRLVKTGEITVDGRAYALRYFEVTTPRGMRRYSCELRLGPGDCIIVDGRSLGDLEWRVARLMPATVYSRSLVRIDAA